jgi:hypothetical protein
MTQSLRNAKGRCHPNLMKAWDVCKEKVYPNLKKATVLIESISKICEDLTLLT